IEDLVDRGTEIQGLRKKIPASLLVSYDRFQMRGKRSVSIVRHDVCNECHLQIPRGVVASLASGEEVQRCGNCGRYLYLPADELVSAPPPPLAKPVKTRRKKELAHVA